MRYIGLDIGRITTCAILDHGTMETLTIRNPHDLAPLIREGDTHLPRHGNCSSVCL